LSEFGAVLFALSGDRQHGVPLQQYVERKYGEDWIENPEMPSPASCGAGGSSGTGPAAVVRRSLSAERAAAWGDVIEDEWEDRPGLTPEEKIEYKALEAIMEKIVRPNGLDGDLCDKVDKDFFETMDKMHKILDRGERRYRKEKLAQKLDTNIATMKATGSSSDQGDDSSSAQCLQEGGKWVRPDVKRREECLRPLGPDFLANGSDEHLDRDVHGAQAWQKEGHGSRGVACPAGGPDEGVGGLRQGAGEGAWLRFVSGIVATARLCE
jgi:hypothetical protein